MRNRVALKEY